MVGFLKLVEKKIIKLYMLIKWYFCKLVWNYIVKLELIMKLIKFDVSVVICLNNCLF